MRPTTEALIERLAERVALCGGDWSARLEGGHEYAWSAEIRLTRFPNVRDQPDQGVVFFQAGGGDAEEAIEPALVAALEVAAGWDPSENGPPTWD